ncbi:MAG: ribonuclease T(2) [Thiohalocapsa sp.]
MKLGVAGLSFVTLLGLSLTSSATIPVDGDLIASRPCEALASIKRGTNPGDLMLQPGARYSVIGKNREHPSHYLIQIDAAASSPRWVPVDCGQLETSDDGEAPPGVAPPAPTAVPETSMAELVADPPMQLMLAASWQNAYCERSSRRPECRSLNAGDAAAVRFSLHGLWPQPIGQSFCDVSSRDRRDAEDGRWSDLPRLDLTPATRARLDALMPGTRSHLQRHEWTKHGTCYGTDAETYFTDSLALVEQLNASPVRALFADNVGRHLSATEVRKVFSGTFGRAAGQRLRLACRDGLITELRISLKGAPGGRADLRDWLRAAPSKSGGCRGGRVAGVGLGRH